MFVPCRRCVVYQTVEIHPPNAGLPAPHGIRSLLVDSRMPDPDLERIIAELERRQAILHRLPHETRREADDDETSHAGTDEPARPEQQS